MRVRFVGCGRCRVWRPLFLTILVAGVTAPWADFAAAASRPKFPPALTRQPKPIEPKSAEEPLPDSSSPSAEVTFGAPQRFAVVVETRTNRRRLYGTKDFILDGKGAEQGFVVEEVRADGVLVRDMRSQKPVRVALGEVMPGAEARRLAETALLEGVHYYYVTPQGSPDPEARVLQIRAQRAVLAVDTAVIRTAHTAAPPESAEGAPAREYAIQTQNRLDATLLGKVRVKGAGRDNYEVSAADLRMAMAHGEQVLMEAWSAVRPTLSWSQGINFRVTSPIADGVLGPNGFRVTSPNLAERAGIEMGDVVLAVNNQPINGFGDVFRLYRQVKADQRISTVELKLERQGQLVTKTYRIR